MSDKPRLPRAKPRKSDDAAALPVLPLRDVVVYPGMVIPLFVGRKKSIRAIEEAMGSAKQILLLTQKKAEVDDPGPDSIYAVGTVSAIRQLLELPDGTIKVLVEGLSRARVASYEGTREYFSARVEPLAESTGAPATEIEGLVRSLRKGFEQYAKINNKLPPEALASLSGIDNASRLADTISAHMTLKLDEKQKILEILVVTQRIEALLKLIESELDILNLEKRIRGRVKQQMEKSQREYYLNEQMKAIQQELSDSDDNTGEAEELARKIKEAGMSKEAEKKAKQELGKLRMMSPMSAEATVVRNYIDWLVNVPWKKRSRVCRDLQKAERVLERDHYGLDKIKERILEYLAVQHRVKKIKGTRSCAWSARPASARPAWASPSPGPPAASSPACRSAACATRPRSAAIAAPTSAPCPARSCRTCRASACATRCSCSTRSTRWPWTSAATRPRRCSKCWIRSRTTCSTTTTWKWTSTCRTSCSCAPPTP